MKISITLLLAIIVGSSIYTISEMASSTKNILGTELQSCCFEPKTGYYRDGFCHTGPTDSGIHVVCAEMTDDFLQYSKSQGNDLITPFPQFDFPGLKAGEKWCLCAARWEEARQAGVAPPVVLESTHEKALTITKLEYLKAHELQPKR